MDIKLPPTKGRGKWGRKIKCRRRNRDCLRPLVEQTQVVIEYRTGCGTLVRTEADVVAYRRHTPGTMRHNFFSSPNLREWFSRHDAVIDERIGMAERGESECRRQNGADNHNRRSSQTKRRSD